MGPFPRQLVWNKQNRFMSVWLKRSCGAGGVRGGGWFQTGMSLAQRKDEKRELIAQSP